MGSLNFITSPYLLASFGMLFVAIVILVVAANGIIADRRRLARRLEAPQQYHARGGVAPKIALDDDILQKFARFVTPTDDKETAQTRLRLIRAGFRLPSAVRIFHLSRAVFSVTYALLGAIILPILVGSLPLPILVLLILFSFIIGFLLPSLWIDFLISRRKQMAEEGFPDTLDLLLVCIEAGQGFDQAARRIARELKGHNKVLAEEFSIMNDELWAGKDRVAVFRDFSQRLALDDITAFVTVLRQSDEFGVSVAEAIRVYAADMRHKRVMRAEEKANMMPLKLALASMFFTVPPTMLIMVGPSLLMILRAFTGGHGG
ncbi:MAG: type II secretion system F family protein [Alphaproteobacteria bacterium]|nr:type II secretion system F family protein [Alphaproteobacteria bacterium]